MEGTLYAWRPETTGLAMQDAAPLTLTPLMSSPRAATSVASRKAAWFCRKRSSDSRRAVCVMSPCSSAVEGEGEWGGGRN